MSLLYSFPRLDNKPTTSSGIVNQLMIKNAPTCVRRNFVLISVHSSSTFNNNKIPVYHKSNKFLVQDGKNHSITLQYRIQSAKLRENSLNWEQSRTTTKVEFQIDCPIKRNT